MSLSSFLGSHDRESFFTNTQRHRVVSVGNSLLLIRLVCLMDISFKCPFQVYEILTRTIYGKRKNAQVGVDRLLNEGVYTAAFPLHEVRFLYWLFGLNQKKRLIFDQ